MAVRKNGVYLPKKKAGNNYYNYRKKGGPYSRTGAEELFEN